MKNSKLIKRIFLLFLIFNVYSLNAQYCNYPTRKKVLLVGDSWGSFMWIYRSYKEAFTKYGFPDYIEEGTNTVENGAEAEDYIVNPKLNYVINNLNSNPDIDLVLISLGGNDILGDWHKDFIQSQKDSLLDTIQARLEILIDTIKQTKPNVQILLSGYDYPNFGETCFLVPTGAYANLFADMGSPSFEEINNVLVLLIQRFTLMAQNDPQLNIVSNLGLMQYMYGQSANLIVPPYSPAYPPYSVPLPGGDINYPSPRTAMLANIDAFHLNQGGFQHFANRQTELFFWEHFRRNKDTSFVSMGGLNDGFIDAAGNITNSQLAIGNKTATTEVSSILSFNTEALPDNAIVTEARLFLTRNSLVNQNPITTYGSDKIIVDIASGHFGTSVEVEPIDFTDSADADNIACLIGTAENNNYKIRFEMPDSNHLNFINKTGITQFRISVNSYDSNATNIMYFFGNNAPATNMPILDIKYTLAVGLTEENNSSEIKIFPNPASDILNINGANIKNIEISSIDGKIVYSKQYKSSNLSIDISGFSSGFYLIKVITEEKIWSKKLIIE